MNRDISSRKEVEGFGTRDSLHTTRSRLRLGTLAGKWPRRNVGWRHKCLGSTSSYARVYSARVVWGHWLACVAIARRATKASGLGIGGATTTILLPRVLGGSHREVGNLTDIITNVSEEWNLRFEKLTLSLDQLTRCGSSRDMAS